MQECIIIFDHLQDAEDQIKNSPADASITLINSPFAVHSLGMITIDYIMKHLSSTYPQITQSLIDCDNAISAKITASQMGYAITNNKKAPKPNLA